MKYLSIIILIIVITWFGFLFFKEKEVVIPPTETPAGIPAEVLAQNVIQKKEKENLIRLSSPTGETAIESPLVITGEARGYWFFEATFPIVLTNWDGLIIAEGYATADGEWMTEDFVPFTAELTFTKPEYGERGSFILQKSNASGLPEHDDALEITVWFK